MEPSRRAGALHGQVDHPGAGQGHGSSYTSKRFQEEIHGLRQWIHIFWLPTCTSEPLNLIENVGAYLQRIYFSRMLTRDPNDFPVAVVQLVKKLARLGALRRMLRPLCAPERCTELLRVAWPVQPVEPPGTTGPIARLE